MNIKQKILSDPVNSWIFKQTKGDIYLVGGYVRDLLRDSESRDKDFVLRGSAKVIALRSACQFAGKFIELKKNQTFRVVLKEHTFIDFTQIRGNVLHDLGRRDFTVNAIAWSPDKGIIAPETYLDDLRQGIIRVIKPENFLRDPIRLLRAYRLSAETHFSIDSGTRIHLKKYSSRIKQAAPERITEEVFKMMDTQNVSDICKLCNEDNVLSSILPLSHYFIKRNIDSIRSLDHILERLLVTNRFERVAKKLEETFSQNLKRSGVLRLYVLLRNDALLYKNCMNHDRVQISYLRMSTKVKKSLKLLYQADSLSFKRISDKMLFALFTMTDDMLYEASILLTMKRKGWRIVSRAEEFERFQHSDLITGDEIKKMMNIKPGVLVGHIKQRAMEMIFRGKLRNRREVRKWVIANFT